MEVRMREIAVVLENGATVWENSQLTHQAAADAAKEIAAEGLRCYVVVRHVDNQSPAYYVKPNGDIYPAPHWFEPRKSNPKQPKPVFEGPKRPPGRPRGEAKPGMPVSVVLTPDEIAKAEAAGNGNVSAGIRKAIALLA